MGKREDKNITRTNGYNLELLNNNNYKKNVFIDIEINLIEPTQKVPQPFKIGKTRIFTSDC